ncbi:MAG: HlyD family type I secretion periplasmic adaptor subunit [Saezia sp.]
MSMKHRWEAYKELRSRYKQIFAYYWQRRHEMPTNLFTEDEAEFMPAALAVQERPVSKTGLIISRLLILLILIAFAWAIFGRMDIVVNAMGKIIPSEYTKTIAAVDTAKVVRVYVQEGQQVRQGDILLELDMGATQAEHDKALGEMAEYALQLERNLAMLAAIDNKTQPVLLSLEEMNERYKLNILPAKWHAAESHVQGQYKDYEAKLIRLQEEIKGYEQSLPLVSQQAANYRRLLATNDVPRNDYLQREQARVQLIGQLETAKSQLNSLSAEVQRTAHEEISQARRGVDVSRQDIERHTSIMSLYTLKAPIDGTVQQLTTHTIGGVAAAAQPLMLIVPLEGPMEVEAFIENKDKGFVHVGQSVAVKVDTFQYTKYGTLAGEVVFVSEDAIEDEKLGLIYAVRIRLHETQLNVEGRMTRVTPGMSVNVEIKTGDRRIIEYVLSPLLKHTRESLNER